MTAFRILRLLFCLKKPEVINLSYLPVIIKDKPILFIVWEIKNVWTVRLVPLKRNYYTAQQALIISIPKQQQQVILKASNFWRKTHIDLTMCAVELKEMEAAKLIQGFRPMNKVEVSVPHISPSRKRLLVRSISFKHKNIIVKKIDRFYVQVQPFH